MTPLERKQIIEQRLNQALSPTLLDIIDESHKHVGHEGAKTGASHFAVVIVSEQFAGLSLIEKHRLVYEAVGDLIPKEVHALKIKASSRNA